MARVPVWEHFPEILIALSYYPCGAFLGFILHSHNTIDGHWNIDISFTYALCFAIVGAFLTAVALSLTKLLAKRIVWLHCYLLAIGNILLLTCGIVLISNRNSYWNDYSLSTILGGTGHGIVYITGMAYIYVRTNSYKHRVARLALCHLGIAIGMTSSVSYMGYMFRWRGNYYIFGHFIMYSSASILACLLLNELFHALGVYNYKRCLDQQLREADKKKDRLQSALSFGNAKKRSCNQCSLALTAILSKASTSFLYNNIFLLVALSAQTRLVGSYGMWYSILHYFMLAGVVIGMIMSLSMKIKLQYPILLVVKCVFLIVAGISWTARNYEVAGVFFWLFYLVAAASVFIPDVAIMEVSNPNVYELNLFLGFLVEQIPIIVSIACVRNDFFRIVYGNEYLWTNIGICVGITVVVSILFLARYPNTYHLRVLEIQRLILFNTTRGFQPVNRPAPAVLPSYPQLPVVTAFPPVVAQQAVPFSAPAGGGVANHGYYSAQPLYPGQQPVYMVPPYYPSPYPTLPSATSSTSAAAPGPYASVIAKTSEASAPQLTPVTETEQVLWQQQHQMMTTQEQPPPSYGSY